MKLIRSFVRDELGQDLSEMSLLIAFVAIASTATYLSVGGSVGGIWTKTTVQLAAANSSAPVTPPSSGGGSGSSGCRDEEHRCR